MPLQPVDDVIEVDEEAVDGDSVNVEGAIAVGVALLVVVSVEGPICEEVSVELPLVVTEFVVTPVRDESVSVEWRADLLVDEDESVVVDVSIE